MATGVYDDEKQKSDDGLQSLHDREFNDIAKHYDDETEHPLGDRETGAGTGQNSGSTSGDAGSKTRPESNENESENSQEDSKLDRTRKFFWGSRRRKQATVGVSGLTIAAVGGSVFLSTLFAPIKVLSITTHLQDVFFASSEQAVGDASEKLMQHYLVKKVMPGMVSGKCNSTRISRSCAVIGNGKGPVSALFSAWKDARLENKLYQKYGIEIIKTNDNKFYFRSDNLQHRIYLGEYTPSRRIEFERRVFSQLNSKEVRRETWHAFDSETLWKRMMHRFGAMRLISKKYGARFCIMSCSVQRKAADKWAGVKTDTKRQFFKPVFSERVVGAQTEMYSLVIDCALNSFDCTDGKEVGDDGRVTDSADRDLQSRLDDFRSKFGDTEVDKLMKESEELRKNGMSEYLLKKLIGETAGKIGSKAIPVVGWIDLGAKLMDGARNAKPAIRKLAYASLAVTAIQTYSTYRASADEIKNGDIDLEAVGSIATSLSYDKNNDQGGAAAEQTPAYNELFKAPEPKTSFYDALSPTTYAASDTASSSAVYKCDDGKPPTTITCPEEKVGALSNFGKRLDLALSVYSSPLYAVQGTTAKFWNKTAGWVLGKVEGVFGRAAVVAVKALGLGWILDKTQQFAAAAIKTLVTFIIPNPITDNPSGGRLFSLAAAGADFAGNDYAHYGIGGQVLTAKQTATIQQRRLAEERQDLSQMSLFARVFSTSTPNSLIAKLALETPSSVASGTESVITTIFKNPAQLLSGTFSSLFTSRIASAAGEDLFGITQYGYPDGVIDKVMQDPEGYWDKNCKDITKSNKAWGEKAFKNDETGQYENSTPNPCLLLQTAVASAGGKFDTDLIPDYEDTDDTGTGGLTGSLNVATFNIRHKGSPGDRYYADWKERLHRSANTIIRNKLDVVGLQEVYADQQQLLLNKDYLGDDSYAHYAKWPVSSKRPNFTPNPVVYNSDKYEVVESDSKKFAIKYDGKMRNNEVAVKLRAKDGGGSFYFINVHDAAGVRGGNDSVRAANARIYVKLINELSKENIPIFVVGDFNSQYGTGANDPSCILSKSGVVKDTWEIYKHIAGCAGSRPIGSNIDRVYASKGLEVTNFWAAPRPANGSDVHDTIMVTIALGDDTAEKSTEGWVWPVSKNDWHGPFGSNVWGSLYEQCRHAGVDIGVGVGTTVLAAHDGTIVQRNSTSSGYGGGYLIKVDGANLWYAYQHMSVANLSVGTKVKAGQVVGKSGCTGNCYGAHVHFSIEKTARISTYADGSGICDVSTVECAKRMISYPPLCFLPKPAGYNYGSSVPNSRVIGSSYCKEVAGT